MATVTIHFVGPLRLYVQSRSCTLDATDLQEVRESLLAAYGDVYRQSLQDRNIKSSRSLWDDCNVLLNRSNIQFIDPPTLKDGDQIYLLLQVAGG
ncbi:MAG: MoaD/ThiS family protein [bacterium]